MAIPTPSITSINNDSAAVYIRYNNNATLANDADMIYCYRGTSTNPTEVIDSRTTSYIFPDSSMAFQWLYDFGSHTKSIEGNTRYYYRLRCSYNGTYGDYSSTSSIITCPAPTYVRLIDITTTSVTVSISCEPSGSALTTYLKYTIVSSDGGATSTVDTGITNLQGSTTTYTINNLTPHKNYTVFFFLENSSGRGGSDYILFSTCAFYGPKSGSQTISTPSSNFTLSDTANMGLYSKLNSSSNLNVKLYGDTEQPTTNGVVSDTLMPLVPVTNMTPNWSQQATYDYVWDDELKRNVLHIMGNGDYPGLSFALSRYVTYSTGRNYAVSVKYKLRASGTAGNGGYGGVSFNGRNNWELLGNETTGWTKTSNSDATTQVPGLSLRRSETWTTATVRTSKDAAPTYTPTRLTVELREALYSGVQCEMWISDIEVREITDAEYAAATYTPTFTPYTDGNISPSPDYPMTVQTVTGLQTIDITGPNGESQEYEIDLGDIKLCKIGSYQDYIYKNDDKWYLHKEVGKVLIADGSYALVNGKIQSTDAFPTDRLAASEALMEYYTYTPMRTGITSNIEDYQFGFNTGERITFGGTHTVADFTSWASANNVAVYYALATPTDTEITEEGLLESLEKFANIAYAYPENTTFSTRGSLPVLLGGDFPYTDGTDTSEKIVKLYGSVDGKTKEVKKLYGSVNGKTKLILNNS